jgi:ferrous iron transport protein B
MKIALAGNPNSGKTTLFNRVTGKTEYVGNWPGVTVEKKEANVKNKYVLNDETIRIVDLPGAYSISPYTGEEVITRDFVLGENPDVIINIVDGANLSRSLFFTTQLLELGIPVVIALNKGDILNQRGDIVDAGALGKALNCSVIETTANANKGLEKLISETIRVAKANKGQLSTNLVDKNDIERQKFIDQVISTSHTKKRDSSKINLSDKIDRIVADKWLGIPIFFLVMWAVFAFSINGLGGLLSGFMNDVVFGEIIPDAANGFLEGLGIHSLLQSLIVEGIIGGVGAVIGFLPLIMVLFFSLSLLEDSGYMARVAVVMDRYFKKIGLSGKSIIPMIVGTGCSIPGVMATRTIRDINERRMTTILTPFVPCGAKLPIIALFVSVFFADNTWVGPSMYIIAITMIVLGGLLLKKLFVWENTSSFIMELPEYKIPSIKHATVQMYNQAKAFVVKASTIILICNTAVWFAQAYSWSLQPVENQSLSILASIGGLIAPLLIPLGFLGWQMAAATVTGFIAKENVVGTLAVLLLSSDAVLHTANGPLSGFFTPVTAFAFLVFNLFTPPCFAAIGAMNAELGSKKWLIRAISFQLGVGYILALLVTHIGTLIFEGKTAPGFVPAIIILLSTISYVLYLIKKNNKEHIELKKAA